MSDVSTTAEETPAEVLKPDLTAMAQARGEHWGLLFGVQKSMRYHRHMRDYFERQHNIASVFTVLYGTTAFLGVLSQLLTQKQAVLVMAVISVLIIRDLVLQSSRRTWQHAALRNRFGELERKLVAKPSTDFTLEEVTELALERKRIEDDEPPEKRALDLVCHNEVVASLYEPDKADEHMYHIPLYMRLTAHSFNWNVNSLRKKDA